jgi:hypothetical protein
LLVYKGFSGGDSRDFPGQGFLAIALRAPVYKGFLQFIALFGTPIFSRIFTPLFQSSPLKRRGHWWFAGEFNLACFCNVPDASVTVGTPIHSQRHPPTRNSRTWSATAPTVEILPVLSPNKVVGITHVPAANSERILRRALVSEHFRGFRGVLGIPDFWVA